MKVVCGRIDCEYLSRGICRLGIIGIGLVGCNIPEIPEGYNPSDKEMKQSIHRAIQATEEYLKREDEE